MCNIYIYTYVCLYAAGLTTGGVVTSPLTGDVKIESVAPWDGEDAQAVEEEEFSLEDILGEEL